MYYRVYLFSVSIVICMTYNAVVAMDRQDEDHTWPVHAIAYRQGDEGAYEDNFFVRRNFLIQAAEDVQPHHVRESGNPGSILSLFDGCGGTKVAAYAKKLAKNILECILQARSGSQQPDIQQLFLDNFKQLDQEIITDKQLRYVGTTAVVAYIYNHKAYIGWVGDTRAILIRDGTIIFSTTDHVLSRQSEADLVYLQETCNDDSDCEYDDTDIHGLKLSHALGVLQARHFVKPVPDVAVVDIKEKDLLLLATKGVWNALTNDQVTDCVRQAMLSGIDSNKMDQARPVVNRNGISEIYGEGGAHRDKKLLHVARELRDRAYAAGSHYNITAMIAAICEQIKSE